MKKGKDAMVYLCNMCSHEETDCRCVKYCMVCKSDEDPRLCTDGCYYCADCREACEYRTQDELGR